MAERPFDQPPKRRRESEHHWQYYCNLPAKDCFVRYCTNPNHPGSWIPDDEPGIQLIDCSIKSKEKEKPVCSSPNVLSSEDLRLIEEIIQKRPPHPDAAERAKEREHEAAMHRRESEESIEKHRQSHITLTRAVNLAGASCISGIVAVGTAASIFFMSQCAGEPTPAKPKANVVTKTAEQMFGMGGK